MVAEAFKWRAINLARRHGWEIRRFNERLAPHDYLRFVVFPHLDVNCVIDVGAHFGEFAQSLRNSGYDGLIVSFEPVAESFAVLRQRAARDRRWTVLNMALGPTNGSQTINVMRETTLSSMLEPSPDQNEYFKPANVVDHVELVDLRRLDSVLPTLTGDIADPRVFLKMDTQGWDLEVFAGTELQLNVIVGIQSELSIMPLYTGMPSFEEALRTYHEHGFAVSALYPVGRDLQLRLVEFDCILVRDQTAQGAVSN